ncbi:MAG: metalloregulator ArsR/SmtB family transcription factor [Peptostreptococcus porci]|nr:metalloregulator ArsR/SmtB family transcription factor [Peptostreptococcus porci]
MVSYKKNSKIFKAFADEKRLRIIDLLTSGEKCACVLLEDLDLTQSGLSYHMKILTDSGIVKSRQSGKWTYYKISEEGRKKIVNLLVDLTKIKLLDERFDIFMRENCSEE